MTDIRAVFGVRKRSKTKSLTFLLQAICHLPGRFGDDRLGGLGDRDLNKIFITYEHKSGAIR